MTGLDGIELSSGTKVLLLWAGSQMSANMQNVASTISDKVKGGDDGRIQLEHIDRLLLCKSIYISMYIYVISGTEKILLA